MTIELPIEENGVIAWRLFFFDGSQFYQLQEVSVAKKSAFGAMLNEAPDSNVVPEGMYLTKIVKITEKHSKAGKLMMSAQYQIQEPKALKGQMIFENFVLGTDEDPEAENVATFKNSIGARAYKNLLKKAGVSVEKTDEVDDIAQKAAGCEIMLSVQQNEQQEGPYKGQLQNRIAAYYEPGEREPQVTGEGGKAAAKPAAAKKPKPAPVDDDDEDDDEEEAPAPKKKPGPKPKPKVEEEEEEDDEDDEDEDDDDED